MNSSRIEIPLTLPPPHFDDDATIATARQVVPIGGARRIQRARRVLTLAPLLIASTLCGALGAVAVNYYERRRETAVSATQQQALPSVSTDARVESPAVTAAPEINAKTEVQASVPPKDTAVIAANEPATKSESAPDARVDNSQPEKSAAVAKRDATADASKLVRKRRVQPPDSEIPPQRNRRNGASRIEDLFSGPNP